MKYVKLFENYKEKSFQYYSEHPEMIFSKKFLDEQYKDKDNIYIFKIDSNYNDDIPDTEIIKMSEYRTFINEFFYDNLRIAISKIDERIHKDKIQIHRAMTVGDDYLDSIYKQGANLGIYWSWSFNDVETYWADYSKNNTIVISTIVPLKYVDWRTTLLMNSHPHFKIEKEIRLFKNKPIFINGIVLNDEHLDIGDLVDKKFHS